MLSNDLRLVLAAVPGCHILLDPEFAIVGASDTYLSATQTRRDQIVGRHVFDVFPGNPDQPEASAVSGLTASFHRVLSLRRPDIMPILRHDLRAAGGRGFIEKYWKPTNTPVVGVDGEVKWILLSVDDVTELVSPKLRGGEGTPLRQAKRMILDQLRAANVLLSGLSSPLWEVLRDNLKPVALTSGAIMTEPLQRASTVYFPLSGLYSAAHHLEDGSAIEVALGSRNVLIGMSVLTHGGLEHLETRCLIEGAALAIDADVLSTVLTVHPDLRVHLSQIIPMLMTRMSLSVACAARHSLEQRLALWLLTASDRVDSLELDVAQETLSLLLGVRRTGVSETLGRLSEAGLVKTGRNVIVIPDKGRLKSRACGCYDELESLRAAYPFARVRVDPGTVAGLPGLLRDYATLMNEANA